MLNVCALVGRLVADPEVRQGAAGTTVCRFRIAVDRDFVRQGEQRQADFIPCVAFGRTGEFVSKWFRKGSWIAVNGRLRQDSYTDRNGQNRTSYEVNVENVSFVGSKSDGQTRQEAAPAGNTDIAGGEMYPGEKLSDYQPHKAKAAPDAEGFAEIDDNEDLPF